jgi:hypothetical protein
MPCRLVYGFQSGIIRVELPEEGGCVSSPCRLQYGIITQNLVAGCQCLGGMFFLYLHSPLPCKWWQNASKCWYSPVRLYPYGHNSLSSRLVPTFRRNMLVTYWRTTEYCTWTLLPTYKTTRIWGTRFEGRGCMCSFPYTWPRTLRWSVQAWWPGFRCVMRSSRGDECSSDLN